MGNKAKRSLKIKFKEAKFYKEWKKLDLNNTLDEKLLFLFLPFFLTAKTSKNLGELLSKFPNLYYLPNPLNCEMKKIWQIIHDNKEEYMVLAWLSSLTEPGIRRFTDDKKLLHYCWNHQIEKCFEKYRWQSEKIYERIRVGDKSDGYCLATMIIANDVYGISVCGFFEKINRKLLIQLDFGRADLQLIKKLKEIDAIFYLEEKASSENAKIIFEFSVADDFSLNADSVEYTDCDPGYRLPISELLSLIGANISYCG